MEKDNMNDRLSRIRESEKKSHTEILSKDCTIDCVDLLDIAIEKLNHKCMMEHNDEAFGEALKKLEARL